MQAITPGRRTRARLDVKDVVVYEQAWSTYRAGNDMARDGLGPANSQNVHRLGTGGITLKPLQAERHHASERGDTANATVRLAQMEAAPGFAEKPNHRKNSDLTGLAYDAGVAISGDF